jgi:hypothetical protein
MFDDKVNEPNADRPDAVDVTPDFAAETELDLDDVLKAFERIDRLEREVSDLRARLAILEADAEWAH